MVYSVHIRVFEILEFQNFVRLNYNHDASGQLLDKVGRYRLPTILTPDIFARDTDITGTFWHMHVSTLQTYRHMDILSLWMFGHKNFLTRGHFGTRNFWHHEHRIFWKVNISAQYKSCYTLNYIFIWIFVDAAHVVERL